MTDHCDRDLALGAHEDAGRADAGALDDPLGYNAQVAVARNQPVATAELRWDASSEVSIDPKGRPTEYPLCGNGKPFCWGAQKREASICRGCTCRTIGMSYGFCALAQTASRWSRATAYGPLWTTGRRPRVNRRNRRE